MTISLSDNDPRISYTVNSGVTQTTFTVPFEFFDLDDLKVYVDGTLKTKTTHYTLASGGSGATGSITMSVTGAAGNSTVVITRSIALQRTTDFQTSGPFAVASLNTELDKIIAIQADLKDDIDRSLRLTDFDTDIALSLPDVDTRKGKTLAFNASTGAVESGPSISDVQTVSAAAADIASLADIEDGTTATDAISGVAAIASNVSTVAGVASNVTTVAGVTTNMQTIADNLSAVQNAATNATTATTKASEAATSATNAASSATSANSSASTATTKASEASTSATNAASSASTASGHKDTATTKASEAASSATAAASSASTASTQASNASTSASTSSTQATNSANSATASANSATAAANSATAAGSSATAAASSQTAAASSAAAAATALDSFDDRYLGVKSSNPTQDNDGNSLVSGALYFNDSANEMRVYDGANWIAATSAGNVSLILYEYTATSNQTTFSGSDDNSATLSYTVDNLQVVMNGVVLDPSDFTATNGTSVVLAAGAATGDLINIYAFKSFTTADMVSKTNGGTFAGAVTVPQLNADNIRIDSNTISSTDTNGDITLDPNGTGKTVIQGGDSNYFFAMKGGTYGLRYNSNTSSSQMMIEAVDDTLAASHEPLFIGGSTVSLGIAGSEKVKVDASGNVGIGCAPNVELEISGASEMLRLQSTDTNKASIKGAGSGGDRWLLGTVASNDSVTLQATSATGELLFKTGGTNERLRIDSGGSLLGPPSANFNIKTGSGTGDMTFSTNGSERARLDANGVVLVNTTSGLGSAKLVVSADTSSANPMTVSNTRTSASTDYSIIFYRAGNIVGSVQTSLSATSFVTSSDHRLKENVADVTGAIDRVKALAPKRFNFIADTDTTVDGFLAHEAQAVVPEAVTGTKDEVDDDGNAVMQGIDQSKLVPLLCAALKESIAKIETLETKVAALEAGS